jgi:hypothetical protein
MGCASVQAMRFALAALVAGVALVAAGCGGGDSEATSAEEWADEFCTIVGDWRDDLDRIGDELDDDFSADSLEQAAEEADQATDDFVNELRDLGGPDTESGDVVEQEVEELGDTVEDEREELRDAIEDADGLSGAAEAVGAVGRSLADMAVALEETLRAIDDADPGGELRTALEESEACDQVTD